MKAFQFRLDQALRWRATQADLAKAKVAAAAGHLSGLQAQLESQRIQVSGDARDVVTGAAGLSLETWAAYLKKARREMILIEKQIREAERNLGEQLRLVVEANRKVRLLENLKQSERTHWNAELDRELDTFSGEAFLVRYNRESSRARSSGG
jgi:capsule polysaccharide export protein KpsE/RkpR